MTERDPETGEFVSNGDTDERQQQTPEQPPGGGDATVEAAQDRYANGETDELELEQELEAAMETERQGQGQPQGHGQGQGQRQPQAQGGRGQQPRGQQQPQSNQQGGQQPAQQSRQGQGMNDPEKNERRKQRRQNPPQQQRQQQPAQRPDQQRRGQQAQGQGQAQNQGQRRQGRQGQQQPAQQQPGQQQPAQQPPQQGQQSEPGPMPGMGNAENAPRGADGMTPEEFAESDRNASGRDTSDVDPAQAMGQILGDEQTDHTTLDTPDGRFDFIIHEPDPYLSRDCQRLLPDEYKEWLREGVEEYGGLTELQEALESGEREAQLPDVSGECLRKMHELVGDSFEHDHPVEGKISPNMFKDYLRRRVPDIFAIVLAMQAMAVGDSGEQIENFRVD